MFFIIKILERQEQTVSRQRGIESKSTSIETKNRIKCQQKQKYKRKTIYKKNKIDG